MSSRLILGAVRYLKSEPIMREFYDEYDEDGNGIGPVTDVRWEVQFAWKATLDTDVMR